MLTRRDFLSAAAVAPAAYLLGDRLRDFEQSEAVGWAEADRILARIKTPQFADRTFSITNYGARPGTADATDAIRQAIAACSKSGGGRVVVPAGEFVTGAVHLQSNVDLHLEAGST